MRNLDGKYSVDGDRIIKKQTGDPIPDDEPVILFRARDRFALEALKTYRLFCGTGGCNDYHLEGIDYMIHKFEDFAGANPEKMKIPGITKGK